jgi:hypothetical protein
MKPRRRQGNIARLVILIVLLIICIWMLHRSFIALPPAPPPTVKRAGLSPVATVGQACPEHSRGKLASCHLPFAVGSAPG